MYCQFCFISHGQMLLAVVPVNLQGILFTVKTTILLPDPVGGNHVHIFTRQFVPRVVFQVVGLSGKADRKRGGG